MSTDSDVGSFVSQPIHPNTPNPYNIPSGSFTSTAPAEPINNEPRVCSVRGCSLPLAPGAMNKMCEACRGRHRVYASTKRARRKMEKAAVIGIRAMGQQLNNENSGVWTAATSVPSAAGATASTAAVTWDQAAIDPRLFAESSTNNVSHLSVYQNTTYPKGSTSELAGALTLPTSTISASSSTPSVLHPSQPTTENNVDHHSGNGEGGDVSNSDSEFEDQEEHEVSATLQPASPGGTPAAIEGTGQIDPDTSPPRVCSVKGCKLLIPSGYTFKMCPSCRTRYRTYGNTKRAKWKAEREAFDRELAGLRTKEDERRRQAGERSLSESPDDLRAWELSIIDEQVSPPIDTHGGLTENITGGMEANGMPSLNFNGTINSKPELYADGNSTGLSATQLPNPPSAALLHSVNIDTPHPASPYPPKNPLMHAFPLPSRMCTVSHCHKLLPGFYRYKRCEQHRLQNRHHSKLKRVREKVTSTVGPNGEVLEAMDGEEENQKGGKENKATKRLGKKAKIEAADGDSELAHHSTDPNHDEEKPRKRNFICVSDGCHNLLEPAVRWRHCEICRARERVLKREKKELESEEKKEQGERDAQKEVERLREIVRRMAAGEKVDEAILGPEAGASGSGQELQQREGHGESTDMPVELDPVSNTAQRAKEATTTTTTIVDILITTPSVTPTTSANITKLHVRPPALKESPETFQSVFRATPVPFMSTPISNTKTPSDGVTTSSDPAAPSVASTQANTNSVATFGGVNTPNAFGTSSKPLTFAAADTPLTFRAYKPKSATSAVGRLLAQNPELSVQVFKDLLLPGKEKQVNMGLVGDSSYHVYKSAPPPAKEPVVFVPTIPTTPPFIYQPTQKKQRTYATYDGTGTTQPTETRPTQESDSNTNTNNECTDNDANSSKSIVANAIASGSGTTPQPSTIPASVSETTPPSSFIPRKRASRAKSKPTKPPPPAPPPSMPSHYPYTPHSQYPYPYYMPAPYSMSQYGPHTSSYIPSATHPPPPSPIPSSSTYSPYVAHPGAYPYQYPPYGYPSTHPPPPGYSYLPPRYIPSPYSPSAPQPGQLYIPQQLQPGTYPPPYGYSKDTNFSYYHHPLEPLTVEVSSSKKKKRQREQGEVPDADRRPPPPVTSPPTATEQPVPGPGLSTPDMANTTSGPLVKEDTTVGNNAQDSDEDTMAVAKEEAGIASAATTQMRLCGNKTCNRPIPNDAAGAVCERCRVRLKKRQAKAKQRFKLEPRKPILKMREGKKEDDDTSAVILATPEAEA